MSVFHVPSVSANTNARAVGALERLCEHIDAFRTRPLAGEDFERVERELYERFVAAEREVLSQLLEGLDVDVASMEIGGRRYHRVLRSTETYTTAVGTVTAKRTLYRCRRERAVVPMELRARIERYWTPLAARQASCVVAQMTPTEGETLLRELGGSPIVDDRAGATQVVQGTGGIDPRGARRVDLGSGMLRPGLDHRLRSRLVHAHEIT